MNVCHIVNVAKLDHQRIFEKESITLAGNGYNVSIIGFDGPPKTYIRSGVQIKSLGAKATNRFTRMLRQTAKLYSAAVNLNADIYHIHDPEMLKYALKLKKAGKIVIYDSHEDFPELILLKIYIPKPLRKLISYFLRLYENYAMSNLDAVIVCNTKKIDRYKKHNPKVVPILNYPLEKHFLNLNPIGLGSKIICFIGTVSPIWAHDIVIDILEGYPDYKYVLVGPSDPDYLLTLKQKKGWRQVQYSPWESYESVLDIYSKSSVAMLLQNYSLNWGGKDGSVGVIKFFECMASGLPMLCSDQTLWKEIIYDEGCGICVAPDDRNAIKEALVSILEDPSLAGRMSKNGKSAFLNKYSWEAGCAPALLDLYSFLQGKTLSIY